MTETGQLPLAPMKLRRSHHVGPRKQRGMRGSGGARSYEHLIYLPVKECHETPKGAKSNNYLQVTPYIPSIRQQLAKKPPRVVQSFFFDIKNQLRYDKILAESQEEKLPYMPLHIPRKMKTYAGQTLVFSVPKFFDTEGQQPPLILLYVPEQPVTPVNQVMYQPLVCADISKSSLSHLAPSAVVFNIPKFFDANYDIQEEPPAQRQHTCGQGIEPVEPENITLYPIFIKSAGDCKPNEDTGDDIKTGEQQEWKQQPPGAPVYYLVNPSGEAYNKLREQIAQKKNNAQRQSSEKNGEGAKESNQPGNADSQGGTQGAPVSKKMGKKKLDFEDDIVKNIEYKNSRMLIPYQYQVCILEQKTVRPRLTQIGMECQKNAQLEACTSGKTGTELLEGTKKIEEVPNLQPKKTTLYNPFLEEFNSTFKFTIDAEDLVERLCYSPPVSPALSVKKAVVEIPKEKRMQDKSNDCISDKNSTGQKVTDGNCERKDQLIILNPKEAGKTELLEDGISLIVAGLFLFKTMKGPTNKELQDRLEYLLNRLTALNMKELIEIPANAQVLQLDDQATSFINTGRQKIIELRSIEPTEVQYGIYAEDVNSRPTSSDSSSGKERCYLSPGIYSVPKRSLLRNGLLSNRQSSNGITLEEFAFKGPSKADTFMMYPTDHVIPQRDKVQLKDMPSYLSSDKTKDMPAVTVPIKSEPSCELNISSVEALLASMVADKEARTFTWDYFLEEERKRAALSQETPHMSTVGGGDSMPVPASSQPTQPTQFFAYGCQDNTYDPFAAFRGFPSTEYDIFFGVPHLSKKLQAAHEKLEATFRQLWQMPEDDFVQHMLQSKQYPQYLANIMAMKSKMKIMTDEEFEGHFFSHKGVQTNQPDVGPPQ